MKFEKTFLSYAIIVMTAFMILSVLGSCSNGAEQNKQNNILENTATVPDSRDTRTASGQSVQNNQDAQTAANNSMAQQNQAPAPKKIEMRKGPKGSSYFGFDKNSVESKLADFAESPNSRTALPFELDKVRFANKMANLNFATKQQLNNVSKILAAYYGIKMAIVVTPNDNNTELAEKRAESIKNYLVKKGLPASRFQTKVGTDKSKAGKVELEYIPNVSKK